MTVAIIAENLNEEMTGVKAQIPLTYDREIWLEMTIGGWLYLFYGEEEASANAARKTILFTNDNGENQCGQSCRKVFGVSEICEENNKYNDGY